MSSTGLASRPAALLAYGGWWVTGLVFWALERQDRYVRFHAAQAVALFGTLGLLVVVLGALAVVSLTFLPHMFVPLLWVAGLGVGAGLVLWAASMWAALHGWDWRLPVAGRLAERMAGHPAAGGPARDMPGVPSAGDVSGRPDRA